MPDPKGPSQCETSLHTLADMLSSAGSFPDGCIIFIDELDALATSRSSGAPRLALALCSATEAGEESLPLDEGFGKSL